MMGESKKRFVTITGGSHIPQDHKGQLRQVCLRTCSCGSTLAKGCRPVSGVELEQFCGWRRFPL